MTKTMMESRVINPAGTSHDRYCRMNEFFKRIPREFMAIQFSNVKYDGVSKVLADELLRDTVLAFFENDLNTTQTSRKMYMHRNTLSYRLDKIKTLTGLDLRHFCDACVFHILMFKGE